MPQPVEFEARISDRGGLEPVGPRAARVVGRLQTLRGRNALVTVEPERKRRSLRANAYLWLIYQAIADWSGHSKDEIHDAMKKKFLPARELVTPAGELLPTIGSTKKLDTSDFSDFVSQVKVWALESGCPDVPEAGE